MLLDQEEVRTANLAQLGVILMDSTDKALADGDYENLESAYNEIGAEVTRRVTNVGNLRALTDFHYKKWADLTVDRASNAELCNAFYELKAMMTGMTHACGPKEEIVD